MRVVEEIKLLDYKYRETYALLPSEHVAISLAIKIYKRKFLCFTIGEKKVLGYALVGLECDFETDVYYYSPFSFFEDLDEAKEMLEPYLGIR